MKFGYVALVGKSNVGKSTFMNQILKVKLSITSSKVQTTRNAIDGIYNDEDSQIVFFDTPGIYRSMNLMNDEMMKTARRTLNSADLILFMINSYDRINSTDLSIIESIKQSGVKTILVVNKADLITDEEEFFARISEYKAAFDFLESVAVSALYGHNTDCLIEDIKQNLDDGEVLYDRELFTNKPVRFIIAEYIREKVINLTKEEVPHSITVTVDSYKEEENIIKIGASIICDKESQKPIIIGKGGKMIKEIGIQSRADIEALLSSTVYLELFVKVREGWRDKENMLKSYGLVSKDDYE